jgi:hypothetical protein
MVGRFTSSVKKPVPPSKPDVLVHFCFDQEHGEVKPDRCDCELHISRDRAYELTAAGQADFLFVKNLKTEKLTKFHRGLVMRRMIVAGEIIFALTKPLKSNRRDTKHESLKRQIRLKARRILQKLLASGIISPEVATLPDADLDCALRYPDKFLETIPARKQVQESWREIAIEWWGNVLGYLRLSENVGKFMEDADRGKGLTISGTKKKDSDAERLTRITGAHDMDTGRVRIANQRASFWNGAWDYSTGADPRIDHDDDDQATYVEESHG